jgi:hypothetical protein
MPIFPYNTPPSAPSQLTRIHGRYATCTFVGIGTLNVFDWEMEIRAEYADATAHGDYWEVVVPLKYMWTARVRGYFDSAAASYLSAFKGASGAIAGGTADLVPATFTAIGWTSTGSTNHNIFTASGFLVRARFNAPMAMAEQEAELRGSGAPGTSALP